jgi:hypothetical protein
MSGRRLMDDGGLEKRSGARSLCAVAARVVGTALFEAGSALRELSKAAWMVESHFGRRYDAITASTCRIRRRTRLLLRRLAPDRRR